MESRKFVAYNQTRESTLSESVTSVNAALEPLKVLKVLIEGLPANARTGLWLTNFKGVPVARTLSPFDLVYLDKENRVLHGIELSRDGEFAPFRGRPASALVLPPHSLTASQTREGDQLELRARPSEAQETPGTPAPPLAEEAPLAKEPVQEPPELSPSALFFSSLSTPTSAPVKEEALTPPAGSLVASPSTAEHEIPAVETPNLSIPEPPTQEVRPAEFSSDQDFFVPGPRSPEIAEELPSGPVGIEIPESRPTPVSPEALPSGPLIPISQPAVVRGRAVVKPLPSPEAEQPKLEQAAALPHYKDHAPPVAKPKLPWSVRLLRWMFPHLIIQEPERPPDRRRADRQALSGLVAYYFTGGSPEPQRISNISVTGFYLHTDERWMPGTVVRMTLQRVGTKGDDPADTITVNSRIVRWGSDGEGFEFILTDLEE